jgi:hypothetical protein
MFVSDLLDDTICFVLVYLLALVDGSQLAFVAA